MIDDFQLQETARRFFERTAERHRNERLIAAKRWLEVDTPERVEKFLKRRGLHMGLGGALTVESVPTRMAGEVAGMAPDVVLERVLGNNDLMGVAFLEEGLRVAKTIGRVWVNVVSGQPSALGTGFLVSPVLLMTNHHVLETAETARTSLIEFEYQRRADGTLINSTIFNLDPATFFYTDQILDYTVVAVQRVATNGRQLDEFGCNRLSEDEGKAIAAQWANIIQHPGGEPKQISLRENRIVDVLPNYLHYKSDTAQGSSGASVFNDRWEVVALHHSGIPEKTADGRMKAVDGSVWRPEMGESRIAWIANEGVRISRIIKHLRGQLTDSRHRGLFDAMIDPGAEVQAGSPAAASVQQVTRTVEPASPCIAAPACTAPVAITINVGGAFSVPQQAPPSGGTAAHLVPTSRAPAVAAADGDSPTEILAAARAAFASRSNVLGVRLGFVFRDGRITTERALVVTVREKKPVAELNAIKIDELPTSFRGLKVQVTDPTIAEQLLLAKGFSAREALSIDGDSLGAEITYRPPPGPGLARVKARMQVTAHVSPEAGWTQLEPFLEGATRSLTVGMFDFGARHIVKAIETAGRKRGFKQITLNLQPGQSLGDGKGTKAKDLKDSEATDELRKALGRKFQNAWVKVGLVKGWVASSYHIKVAVRDSTAFWLSSGNWQSSNQPLGDPLKKPWERSWLNQYNREWHAIVAHDGLAAEFERYLMHDFENNVGVGPEEGLGLPDILLPDEAFMPTLSERAQPFSYFAPLRENRVFDVQPLLTPDNYHAHALALINSAKDQLLIQNQTFNAPKPNHEKLRELLAAVLTKQKQGVDVRIIFRIIMKADARQNLEALQEFGFDMSRIRVQKNCHTKGIIVDRRRVMLGSQNLSEQGVSLNRDASLIFEDSQLAEYFAGIFQHDWANLASDSIDIAPSGVELAITPGTARPGYTKISVEEFLETL